MKRFFAILLSLACIFALPAAALAAEAPGAVENADAEESSQDAVAPPAGAETPGGAYIADDPPLLRNGTPGTGDIGSPLDYWNENGYPADVAYAYNAGGAADDEWWEIGLVGADDARRAELISMFAERCRLTFFDCKYTYSEREAALDEIITEVKDSHDDGFVQGSLILNSDRVYVVVADGVYGEWADRCAERYGDLVEVAPESEVVYAMDDSALPGGALDTGAGALIDGEERGAGRGGWLLPCALILLALCAAALLYLNRARLIPALRTADGRTVAGGAVPGRRAVERAVTDSEQTPGAHMRDAIMRELDRDS